MRNSYSIEPEIQAYINFAAKNDLKAVKCLTKEYVKPRKNEIGEALNTLMVYPDILSDIMKIEGSSFTMFFAQRIVVRTMSRHRQSFTTCTRAFSKSFLASYDRYVRSMMVPRHQAFVVASTGKQAASIAKEKIMQDLWVKFPLFKNEMIDRPRRKAFVSGTDYAEFRFTAGSVIDVVGGHPRGLRRNSGIFEEVIEMDAQVINEEVIPLVNAPRTTIYGGINPYEPQAQKIFVTTAGSTRSVMVPLHTFPVVTGVAC